MKKFLALASAVVVLTVAMTSTASADGTYHSERIPLHAIDDAPLRSGSVVNIHANGPTVFALERYTLNGALGNHDYELVLMVTPFDPLCESDAVAFASVPMSTNVAGNSHAGSRITPEQVAGLDGTHGVNWMVFDGDTPVYETGCQVVVLD